jgi:hypothetical protein
MWEKRMLLLEFLSLSLNEGFKKLKRDEGMINLPLMKRQWNKAKRKFGIRSEPTSEN